MDVKYSNSEYVIKNYCIIRKIWDLLNWSVQIRENEICHFDTSKIKNLVLFLKYLRKWKFERKWESRSRRFKNNINYMFQKSDKTWKILIVLKMQICWKYELSFGRFHFSFRTMTRRDLLYKKSFKNLKPSKSKSDMKLTF